MNEDIANWVEFLNETTSKANISNISFDKSNVTMDLKMTAIPMLRQFLGEIKGRKLTTVMQSLEKSFQLVAKQLKSEKNLDDMRKLSFLALSNVVVEILREMRVEAYSEGKNFDPIIFLDNYENRILSKVSIKQKKSKETKKKEENVEES